MNTPDAVEMTAKAAVYRGERRFDKALAACDAAMQRYGKTADLLAERAATNHAAGRFAAAAADAEAALRLDRRSVRAWLYLALARAVMGEPAGALQAYDALLSIAPDYGIAYTNRGLLYERLARPRDAFDDYERALRVNTGDYKAHYNRANLLYSLKRYDDCFDAYDHAIAIHPTYVMAYGNRGATYLELERYAEAIEDFTAAIRCEPRAVLPLVNRGVARWKQGNTSDGYADLRRAVDLSPLDPWPSSTMADLLEQEGRWPDALEYFSKASALGDVVASTRAQALTKRLGGHQAPTKPPPRDGTPSRRVDEQWLDTIGVWLHRLAADPAQASADAVWKGTPFASVLAGISQTTAGLDAHTLRSLGDAAFRTAREAREDRRPRDAVHALFQATAYFALGADIENLSVALTNVGAMLAELRHVDAAIRVEHYALTLKSLLGTHPEAISRSLRVIAEMEQVSGKYADARARTELAASVYANAGMTEFAARLVPAIEKLDSMVYVSYEAVRRELDAPAGRTFDEWMAEAQSLRTKEANDARHAALALHAAIDVARRMGSREALRAASLELGSVLYSDLHMFNDAYRHFAAAAMLAVRAGDVVLACDARLSQARAAAETGDFASARELLLESMGELQKDGPSALRADTLGTLSLMCLQLELMEEGLTYLQMATRDAAALSPPELDWFQRQARILRSADLQAAADYVLLEGIGAAAVDRRAQLGMLEQFSHQMYQSRDWPRAIEVLRFAIEAASVLGDAAAQARCWTHLGMAALEIEDYELADQARHEATALNDRSDAQAATADLAQLEAQLWSVESSRLITDIDARDLADKYRGRPDTGRHIARTKIDRLLQAESPDPAQIADSYCALAILNERAGRTRLALTELLAGLRTLRKLKSIEQRSDLLQVWGSILVRHNRVRAGWRAFRAAESTRRRSEPQRNPGPLLALIGECRLTLGDGTGANELIEALEGCGDFASEWESPDRRLILSRLHQRWGDGTSARAYATELVNGTNDQVRSEHDADVFAWAAKLSVHENSLPTAEAAAHRVIEAANARDAAEPVDERAVWRRARTNAIEALVAVWHAQSTANAARALALVDRSRVRNVLRALGRGVRTPDSFPENLKRKEGELLAFDRVNSRLARLGPGEQMKMDMVNGTERGALEKFWAGLPDPWREYGERRLGNPGDPITAIRQHLGSEAHVIALYPTDFGTFVWYLKGDGSLLTWRRAETTLPLLQGVCYRLRHALALGIPAPSDTNAIVQDLFGPEVAAVPEQESLCFVPGGPLLQCPFAALPWRQGFLIERHPIAVLPALSLLPYWADRRSLGPRRRAVVLGDTLGDLPEARIEAAAVAAALGTNPLIGGDVQRATLLPSLADCGLLHAACHAFYDERNPDGSGFWLEDRSVLSARDFLEMDCHVRVAVLSACESGRLDVSAGDDLTGIAASMLLSGAASVVSTLWTVDDRTSLNLMTAFYEHVVNDRDDLARALAKAQRKQLARKRIGDWAAFQCSGLWMQEV